jgi:hypothetical protein
MLLTIVIVVNVYLDFWAPDSDLGTKGLFWIKMVLKQNFILTNGDEQEARNCNCKPCHMLTP